MPANVESCVLCGAPVVAQQLTKPPGGREDTGLIPGLAQGVEAPALP